ncbi:MAG: hypothetical protein M5T61_09445 [Acidimicrobiia bacterium]|nr:hypothetical protein [Acidimicrobiia bacterium]
MGEGGDPRAGRPARRARGDHARALDHPAAARPGRSAEPSAEATTGPPQPTRADGARGVLLQADGSRHRWFGPDRPFATLIGAIDDATGTVPAALFREHEDAAGYLAMLRAIAEGPGIPLTLYVDRHGIFTKRASERLTLEEALTGTRLPTQVGRALDELGIRRIHALSAEGKGLIERMWSTIQGRLVAELRIEGITTIAAANDYLPGFLAKLNTRFGVPAAEPEIVYRPLPAELDLDRIYLLQIRAGRGRRQHDPVWWSEPPARIGRRPADAGSDPGRGPRATRWQPRRPVARRAGRGGGGTSGCCHAPGALGVTRPRRSPRPGGPGSTNRPSGATDGTARRRTQTRPSLATLAAEVTKSRPSSGVRVSALRLT